MSGKGTNVYDTKIKKKNFYKNKKPFVIDDIDVNEMFLSKKNHMVKKSLSKLLGIMTMMTLDHYV